jgi:hypothetical protein
VAFGDRSTAPSTKKKPVPTHYTPPYKVGGGDVKTDSDRGRAENYKKTEGYAKSIRAAYSANSPRARSEEATKAQARVNLKGPRTFNGMNLAPSREDRIVLAEHLRRTRQSSAARQFRNPLNDIAADMPAARSWNRKYGVEGDRSAPLSSWLPKLQTGQTAWGKRPHNADTQLAANHPGIETDFERAVSFVARKINNGNPTWADQQDGRQPGDYRQIAGYKDPVSDIHREHDNGGAIFAAIGPDLITKADNIVSQAGHLGVDAAVGAIRKVPWCGGGAAARGRHGGYRQGGDGDRRPGQRGQGLRRPLRPGAAVALPPGPDRREGPGGRPDAAAPGHQGLQVHVHRQGPGGAPAVGADAGPGRGVCAGARCGRYRAHGGLRGRSGHRALRCRREGRLRACWRRLRRKARAAGQRIGQFSSTLGREPVVPARQGHADRAALLARRDQQAPGAEAL